MSEQNQAETTETIVQLQRLYVKDVSFEVPNAPHIFQVEWNPEVHMDLDSSSQKLADDVYEVSLRVTITAKIDEDIAFLCEVQQAGIFSVTGLPEEQMGHFLGAYCPSILFPYVRECISSMVTRGTFPQLNIAPMINFDAIYLNHLQQAENSSNTQLDS